MKGRLEQSSTQNLKQIQRLILSPQMQQALHLLQLPVLELETMIQEELTQNPLLEHSDAEEPSLIDELEILRALESPSSSYQGGREEEDLQSFIENTLTYESSLFDHLTQQAYETLSSPEERRLAALIIGHLDHNGLLTTSLEEIAELNESNITALASILDIIQTFDPPGIGARSVQEALLIQLKGKGKRESLAFRILEHHYDDVMHNRIPAIAKALSQSIEEIRETISNEIAHLDLHPGATQNEGHYQQISQRVTADLMISYSHGKLSVTINEEHIPPLRLNRDYLSLLRDSSLPEETRSYIHEKISSGKWLLRNLHERHHTLFRIGEELIVYQKEFFTSAKGMLVPLTMKEVAESLALHESTIARAVANKYVASPRGILPLRSFFTHAYTTDSGENISADTVKGILIELLKKEDRKAPLSDEVLSTLIREHGVFCARRTVAKYRQELGVGNTAQRRLH